MNQLPVGVGAVAICPNKKLATTLIRVLAEVRGFTPTQKSDSESSNRVYYPLAVSRFLITTPVPAVLDVLGNPSAALSIETPNRVGAAYRAKKILNEAGFEADIHSDVLQEFPAGLVIFVRIHAMPGLVLMYWPTPEELTSEFATARKLPGRKPWTQADLD